MEYIKIKNIDIDVSRIALGTWAIGGWLWGGTDKNDSENTILTALDKGINMIDTAAVYGFGLSEEIIGKTIKQYYEREKIVIATKCGLSWQGDKIYRDSSRKKIFKEIDDSLKRLQTDYIDIYQVHWPDKNTPFVETAEALYSLMEKGKIKAIGISNFSVEQMENFRKETPIHINQPPYNLFEREIEDDILPYCKENGISTLAYGSICRGLLSGKMSEDTRFEGDDNRLSDPKFLNEEFKHNLKIVDKLNAFAKDNYGKKVIDLALRWILDKGVEVAIFGARRPEQLDAIDNLDGWNIDGEEMKEIDEILI
jgi:aryl-alcohol dehydrogenase-like predicted oxidoreductase